MPRFRKKPVIIEAVQYTGSNARFVEHWLRGRGKGQRVAFAGPGGSMFIETLEGRMEASPQDWIIVGVDGEKYPCKPDIFKKTYEQVY